MTRCYKEAKNPTKKLNTGFDNFLYQKFEDYIFLQKAMFKFTFTAKSSKNIAGLSSLETPAEEQICERIVNSLWEIENNMLYRSTWFHSKIIKLLSKLLPTNWCKKEREPHIIATYALCKKISPINHRSESIIYFRFLSYKYLERIYCKIWNVLFQNLWQVWSY